MPTGVISGSRSTSKSDVKDAQSNDEGGQTTTSESIASSLQQLKKRILAERVSYVKEKVEAARKATVVSSNQLLILSKSRHITTGNDDIKSALAVRMENSLCRLGCLDQNVWENEVINSRDEGSNVPSSIIYGSSLGVKGVIQSLKITPVQKIPPYTTWIFLDRNQIMAEDQSVVGRRRIYYDPTGNEALICSDSEEEQGDDEEEKYEFSSGEDKMLWCAIQEHGLTEPLLDNLSQNLEVKPSEIQERYEFLLQNDKQQKLLEQGGLENAATIPVVDEIFCGKDLDAAMDSFDNLFCRRCLVFDCRLHGCSQPLVSPSEKTTPWVPPEEDSKLPCGSSCYRLERVKAEETTVTDSSIQVSGEKVASSGIKDGSKTCARRKNSVAADIKSQRPIQSESGLSNEKQAAESSQGDTPVKADSEEIHSKSSEPKKRGRKLKENKINKRTAEQVLFSMRKKQKKIDSDLASSVSGDGSPVCSKSNSKKSNSKLAVAKKKGDVSRSKKMKEAESRAVDVKEEADDDGQSINECDKMQIDEAGSCKMDTTDTNFVKLEKHGWSAIEKGLYAKGVEIFGRNSCLLARNLLYGLKTCSEIAEYMYHIESKANGAAECGASLRSDGSAKGAEVRPRTRLWRRKGRVRRLKYSWKSAGHPLMRKRIADGKDQPCRQYTPCDCQSTCGKQCTCLRSGTCCEKYCGCSKVCKNRFRGCHCAKSQCRSRQCPCFAAGRECDPDVCRNCWVGCGDGTLGGPPQRGDNYECRNMKLLLKQQQRVLLGRSDISGWGAFLRNSVNKHDYLGEYTGELISHKEADKRGKIYDRENSSFLFNLNDQYVLDAYRKGDKLKFANHSPSPNCYAKVIMVAGDHRVGIFAKERICGGEELFYDYRYEPDKAPAWARKPEDAVTKRDDTGPSHGRAQKVAR